ncbi:MAG: hypothetical protein PHC66_00695 [Candidatus Nanoarchaeia archaeon]|nr:hypothetical protein [Candidatus Nanoarchaeia archaeon]MDD5239538.1 hypothetical protein [Candidatus Nanoarchaeia archaeon]
MPVEDLWDPVLAKNNRAPKGSSTVYIGEPNEGESAADMYELFGCEQMVFDGKPKLPSEEETPEPVYEKPKFTQTNLNNIECMAEILDQNNELAAIFEENRKNLRIYPGVQKTNSLSLSTENVVRAHRQAQIDEDYSRIAYQ